MTHAEVAPLSEEDLSYWCKSEPNIQRAWSPSSLKTFQQCPRKYFYSYIQGWRFPSADYFDFGTIYHTVLNEWDRARIEGAGPEEATLLVARRALELTEDYQWTDNRRGREQLVRACVWYADKYADNKLYALPLPSGAPAIEVSFKLLLPLVNPDGDNYLLAGYMDLVAEYGSMAVVVDRKTTVSMVEGRYFEQFSPDNQVSCYVLAANVLLGRNMDGMLIDACQTGVGFSRHERDFASRTPEQLDEWLSDTEVWIRRAETCAMEGHWPMNPNSCHHFRGCEFRQFCNKAASTRAILMDNTMGMVKQRRETMERPK